MYVWIYGQLPFNGDTPYAIYEKIRLEPLQLPRFPIVSEEVKDLISRLLDKQASSRIDTRDALEHIWVTQAGLAPLTSLHGSSHGAWRNPFEPTPEEIEDAMRETFNGSKLVENVLREVTFSPG
jgi:serine/threonine protein kinase